jgi:hypothetical protein
MPRDAEVRCLFANLGVRFRRLIEAALQARIDRKRIAPQMNFNLKARINRSSARTIRQALDQLAAKASIRKDGDEFIVEAEMEGASAKELNRTLLSALRRVEKRTTLRAEWTSGDTTERFFDYVLKKTIKGSG